MGRESYLVVPLASVPERPLELTMAAASLDAEKVIEVLVNDEPIGTVQVGPTVRDVSLPVHPRVASRRRPVEIVLRAPRRGLRPRAAVFVRVMALRLAADG